MSFETPLPPYNASDPQATFLNSSCFDLLLIEMVPFAYRLAQQLTVERSGANTQVDEEEQREAVFRRLDALGYRVGQGLVERSSAPVHFLTEATKLICRYRTPGSPGIGLGSLTRWT